MVIEVPLLQCADDGKAKGVVHEDWFGHVCGLRNDKRSSVMILAWMKVMLQMLCMAHSERAQSMFMMQTY